MIATRAQIQNETLPLYGRTMKLDRLKPVQVGQVPDARVAQDLVASGRASIRAAHAWLRERAEMVARMEAQR